MNYVRCIRLSIVKYNNSIKILYYYVGMLVLCSKFPVLSRSASLAFLWEGTFRDDTITGRARREFVSPMQPFCLVTHRYFSLRDERKCL